MTGWQAEHRGELAKGEVDGDARRGRGHRPAEDEAFGEDQPG